MNPEIGSGGEMECEEEGEKDGGESLPREVTFAFGGPPSDRSHKEGGEDRDDEEAEEDLVRAHPVE
jgi:hypothetical protein